LLQDEPRNRANPASPPPRMMVRRSARGRMSRYMAWYLPLIASSGSKDRAPSAKRMAL
jgi:hypothetical protein